MLSLTVLLLLHVIMNSLAFLRPLLALKKRTLPAISSEGSFWQDLTELWDKGIDTSEDVLRHALRGFLDRKESSISKYITEETVEEQTLSARKRKKIIVVGAGWSAHAFVKVIDAEYFDVLVVSPRPFFIFTPMLASSAVGSVEYRSIVEPIRVSNPLVDFMEAAVIDVLPADKKIVVKSALSYNKDSQFTLKYDHLIFAPGAQTADFGVPGVSKFCSFMKEVEDVRDIKNKILMNFESANLPTSTDDDRRRLLSFVVVGGGPTGVEFVSELSDFLSNDVERLYPRLKNITRIVLINAGGDILSAFDAVLREKAQQSLLARGVDVILKAKVVEVQQSSVVYTTVGDDASTVIDFGLCVWAGGNAIRPVTKLLADRIAATSITTQDVSSNQLNQTEYIRKFGRIRVDPWLRVVGSTDSAFLGSIIAMGDCAVGTVPNVVKQNQAEDAGLHHTGLKFDMSNVLALPQTAQVAAQQGAFAARLFNRGYDLTRLVPSIPLLFTGLERVKSDLSDVNVSSPVFIDPLAWVLLRGAVNAKPFKFLNLGLLAYVGGSKAVAQVQLGNQDLVQASGEEAFLLWRSVYLVKQVSARTRFLVLFDYIKAALFGRDLTSL